MYTLPLEFEGTKRYLKKQLLTAENGKKYKSKSKLLLGLIIQYRGTIWGVDR